MGDKSKIEWTDATWNPVTGCTKVSAGCKNCYAERLFPKVYPGRKFSDIQVHENRLDQPLRWRKPRMVFVNSMSDLFHENIPTAILERIFAVMALCPQHTFQVLTKRPERMQAFLSWEQRPGFVAASAGQDLGRYFRRDGSNWPGWPMKNCWLGVSVEDQATADERIPVLLQTPAAVRFVSYEPALGPVDFGRWIHEIPPSGDSRTGHDGGLFTQIDWVIAGGESGPKARDADPDWFRKVRDDCAAAGVAFFMKQMTKKAPIPDDLMIREYPITQGEVEDFNAER